MNPDTPFTLVDAIQKATVKLVAISPAGHGLLLIGGFRYRFIDQSIRTSKDIDYHWAGDLEDKQRELLGLFKKRLLPEMRRQFGYDGRVTAGDRPGNDSPAVRTVVIALWKLDDGSPRIEIPVEITRVVCADKAEIRTLDGVVYPTLSDADLIECKIVAVFNRRIMEHRDLLDVFLFGNKLLPESPARLKRKMKTLEIAGDDIAERVADLENHRAYHAKAIQAVIDSQLDPAAAMNLNDAGGGARVFERAIETLRNTLGLS